jgi:glycosyltransferase involved in cell wall biosynthesis
MKILLAHKYFKLGGGADVFFFETDRVLRKNGHEVVHFSTIASDNCPSPYTDYFVKPPEYNSGSLLSRAVGIGRMIYSMDAKAKFAQLLNDTKPDLVHVFAIHVHMTPSILVAAYEAGVPVVMSCNDYKHICPNYKLYHHGRICADCNGGHFYKAIANRCCKNSLVFSAASCLEAYAHSALGVYRKYVHTYLFASDFMVRETEKFWGKSFRWAKLRNPFDSSKYSLSEGYDDYVLFFGRFVEEKGVDVLLRAAAHVPEIKIKIVGDGPEELALRCQAVQLGLQNIEFLGSLWGEALNAVLKRARFIVVPSVWHENFPYVINQSFAFGKPVIGSNRGGIPELIADEERGLIYDADDEFALAAAMRRLWQSPGETLRMGRDAKAFVDQEFNDQKFYDELMGIYQGVTDASVNSRR